MADNTRNDDPTRSRSADGAIGYGNPPVGTPFKPGQSGNPKGRPKGETLGEIFRRVAEGPAESRKTGQPVDTEMGHIIRRMFSRVGSYSNPAEARLLLALAREFLPEPTGPALEIRRESLWATDPAKALPDPARRG